VGLVIYAYKVNRIPESAAISKGLR
jgi:hypothetical protein